MGTDEQIRDRVQARVLSDADFFGVADLTPAREAILAWGEMALDVGTIDRHPRALSIGIALMHAIVDPLPRRAERAVALNYHYHGYGLVNQRLDLIASGVSSMLQGAGFSALPVPASQRVDDEKLHGAFSHKLAAHQAGLGWIGKSCLLITPSAGPRVRWATVLTDAPLAATGAPMERRCGDCQECVEICPVQAFTGRPFRAGEPRAARYDAHKCDRYFARMKAEGAEPAVCGLCLYVCPHGRQRAGTE